MHIRPEYSDYSISCPKYTNNTNGYGKFSNSILMFHCQN